jgi:hypothetical protein
VIQAVIDLQEMIQRGGTIHGGEFETAARQQKKRALVELPLYGRATYVPPAAPATAQVR